MTFNGCNWKLRDKMNIRASVFDVDATKIRLVQFRKKAGKLYKQTKNLLIIKKV